MPHSPADGLLQSIENLLKRYFPKKNEEFTRSFSMVGFDEYSKVDRSLPYSRLQEQIWMLLDQRAMDSDEMLWPIDLYFDRGQMYLVVTKDGRLYRMDVTILDDTVFLGEPVEVMESFIPTGRSRQVFRQADGRVRAVAIVATSVLNRSGEIDSRALFDSFVSHWRETGLNPIMNFHHYGDIRLGECDYMAREGYCLVYSYVFDDTPLGRAAGEGYLADPDYWGHSIEFYPSAGDMAEIARDVYVPVYTEGVNTGCALLAETKAAALFTNKSVLRGVNMNDAIKQDLAKLVGGEMADQFAEDVDGTNRAIDEGGMIARATDTEDTAVDDSGLDAELAQVDSVDIDGMEEEEEVEEVEEDAATETEFVMDDETAAALADLVIETDALRSLRDVVSQLTESVNQLTQRVNEQSQVSVRSQRKLEERVVALEKMDQDKQQEWLSDLPRSRSTRNTVNVSYRPRVNRADDSQKNGKAPAASIAEATLDNLPKPKF